MKHEPKAAKEEPFNFQRALHELSSVLGKAQAASCAEYQKHRVLAFTTMQQQWQQAQVEASRAVWDAYRRVIEATPANPSDFAAWQPYRQAVSDLHAAQAAYAEGTRDVAERLEQELANADKELFESSQKQSLGAMKAYVQGVKEIWQRVDVDNIG